MTHLKKAVEGLKYGLIGCPFCNKEPVIRKKESYHCGAASGYKKTFRSYWVECKCGCKTCGFKTAQGAKDFWNTRVSTPQPSEGVDEAVLEDMIRDSLESLRDICPNPVTCSKQVIRVIRPYLRTPQPTAEQEGGEK